MQTTNMIASFWTPTRIPIDAFTIMSASVKFGEHPIGRFGTGLKYAIAIILRHGGNIKLFIDGAEYEFYTSDKNFRGKTLETIRLRKKRGLGKWLKSIQLPFTTHLGSTWELWMAYRELHSNTMDENGITDWDLDVKHRGTHILVDCPGFEEAITESEAFLDVSQLEKLHEASLVTIYDKPSKYLYMDGIRVYTLRYPARFTYDLHATYITLTEDRTIGNLWSVLYDLSLMFMREDVSSSLLEKILSNKKDNSDANTFEARELSFYTDLESSTNFRVALSRYVSIGRGSYAATTFYNARKAKITITETKVSFTPDEVNLIKLALAEYKESAPDRSDECTKLIEKITSGVGTMTPSQANGSDYLEIPF